MTVRRRLPTKAALVAALLLLACLIACREDPVTAQAPPAAETVQLPAPVTDGEMSLERAIMLRRSVRAYSPEPLTWVEIGQLAWAGQGITDPGGRLRASPSAGATYPMEMYFLTPEGVFHYAPAQHAMRRLATEDRRAALAAACLGQSCVRDAPCVIVLTAVAQRTAARYGERATRYIDMEAGHIAQNVLLQAVSLGLAGVPVGAMSYEDVDRVLGLGAGEASLYVVPIGRPR